MNFKIFLFFTLVFFISTVSAAKRTRNRASKRPKANCHMKELDACLKKLDDYQNDTSKVAGLLASSAGLDQICSNTKDSMACARKYMEGCATPIQREIYDFAIEGFTKPIDKFCKPGPDRTEFLESSPCISEKVIGTQKYKDGCVNGFLATLEKIENVEDNDDRLDTACCAYNRWESCMTGQVEKECKEKGKKAMKIFMERSFGRLTDMLCSKNVFKPESERCVSLYAPEGSVSKGKLSSNPITRYMASYFGFLF